MKLYKIDPTDVSNELLLTDFTEFEGGFESTLTLSAVPSSIGTPVRVVCKHEKNVLVVITVYPLRKGKLL